MQSTLYVDSRLRSGGSEGDFTVELRESLQLEDHGVRVDKLRVTNSFLTTDLGRDIYYKDGASIQSFSIPEKAYTGTTLAAALQAATGRSTSYDSDTNSITQTITTGQEWLSDAQLKAYASGFPTGASASAPLSLNQILGDSSSATGNIVWTFVSMAPYDYLFLRSRRLTVENSEDLNGRHDVLAVLPLVKGIGAVEQPSTADGIYMRLPKQMTLRNIDFELTDYKGKSVNLRGRPISFELCFD